MLTQHAVKESASLVGEGGCGDKIIGLCDQLPALSKLAQAVANARRHRDV